MLYIRNFALLKRIYLCWAWWHTPVNPAFRRQKNHKVEAHLGCIMRPFQKQKQSQIKQETLVLQALYIRCILINPHIFIIRILKRESLLLKFYLYSVCMGCYACLHVYVVWACSAQGSLKGAPDAVELELQMFSICNCTM